MVDAPIDAPRVVKVSFRVSGGLVVGWGCGRTQMGQVGQALSRRQWPLTTRQTAVPPINPATTYSSCSTARDNRRRPLRMPCDTLSIAAICRAIGLLRARPARAGTPIRCVAPAAGPAGRDQGDPAARAGPGGNTERQHGLDHDGVEHRPTHRRDATSHMPMRLGC